MAIVGIGSRPVDPIRPAKRPSFLDALGELRFFLEASMFWVKAFTHPWPHAAPGEGRIVLLIPGFMAGDVTLLPLANFLARLGHRPVFSGIWSNSKCPRETLEQLGCRLEQVREASDGEIALVGQSLGGLYARELAHRYPAHLDRVITLGSPIRRPRSHANPAVEAVARGVARLRGKAAGCLSESCECGLAITDDDYDDEEVPTTVIFSRSDGVVHWESCVDSSGSELVENVEVMSSHVGMGLNADVYRVIAERLVLLPYRRRDDDDETADAIPSAI
jgi:pimeloyl-ACP methyl ester carboxylesterase